MPEQTTDPARERLEQDEIASGSLLAISHLHRYDLAAALAAGTRVVDLCCGVGYGTQLIAAQAASVVGVDLDPQAIAAAHELVGDDVRLEVADASAFVTSLDPDDVDMIVCFEGVEHIPNPAALADALARHAAAGVRVLVSLPNSAGFAEENAFHTVDFGFDEAVALFDRIGPHELLTQRLAEGSVIGDARDHADVQEGRSRLFPHDTSEAWAGHWLAACNFDQGELGRTTVRLRSAVVPNHHRYMRSLERANEELYRANLRLAKKHLGRHDAAAGITVGRLERARAAAERENRRLEAVIKDLERRLAAEVAIGIQNDANFQHAQELLSAPRYRAADWVRDSVFAIPGVSRTRRAIKSRRRG